MSTPTTFFGGSTVKGGRIRRLNVAIGTIFGRLEVVSEPETLHHNGRSFRSVECVCSCGSVGKFKLGNLISSRSKSCGCLRSEVSAKKATRHGQAQKTPTHKTWASMKERCSPGGTSCHNYYDRGIRVCERWNDFLAFYEDMGVRPKGMTLERIDNSKGYSPENCRWATQKEQMRNTRKSLYVMFEGERINFAALVEKTGINYMRLWKLMRKYPNTSVEELVSVLKGGAK